MANGDDDSRERGWCKCVSVILLVAVVVVVGNVEVISLNNEGNGVLFIVVKVVSAVELPLVRQMRLNGEVAIEEEEDVDEIMERASSSSQPSSLPMGLAWHSNGALQLRLVGLLMSISSSSSPTAAAFSSWCSNSSQRRFVPFVDERKIDMADRRLRG